MYKLFLLIKELSSTNETTIKKNTGMIYKTTYRTSIK
jgi:hypothetical protein